MNILEEQFLPYNEALTLKELGFNEECFGLFVRDKSLLIKQIPNQQECEQYFGGILAPLHQQAFGFFRNKYNLISRVNVTSYGCTLDEQEFFCGITAKNGIYSYEIFNTYEEAELDCIKRLIELVKTERYGN